MSDTEEFDKLNARIEALEFKLDTVQTEYDETVKQAEALLEKLKGEGE